MFPDGHESGEEGEEEERLIPCAGFPKGGARFVVVVHVVVTSSNVREDGEGDASGDASDGDVSCHAGDDDPDQNEGQ